MAPLSMHRGLGQLPIHPDQLAEDREVCSGSQTRGSKGEERERALDLEPKAHPILSYKKHLVRFSSSTSVTSF
jgi:hypothetical protein